ncbi:hypothetical protein VIGAN_09198300 [Vigna angularis var. angularis]|uniref:Uncharacterized protein n=1 Tax=Vigna angularis var. angularis TaxID=157739 RepID=A0A0S3SZW1_PHAAN|nr:hypothetical protein VIGAN_09198300 [Vigna angularis var. angularis]
MIIDGATMKSFQSGATMKSFQSDSKHKKSRIDFIGLYLPLCIFSLVLVEYMLISLSFRLSTSNVGLSMAWS